jgi:hypothetical protein
MKRKLELKLQSIGGLVPIGDSFVPAEERELKCLEDSLQAGLSKDYRDFLKMFGASMFAEYVDFHPLKNLPASLSKNGNGHVSSFYGAERDRFQPLTKAINVFRGRMPETMIPIGDDNGNKICLGIKGNETGHVYYWDRENEPVDPQEYLEDYGTPRPPEAIFQNVHKIAESFEDFLLGLEIRLG